jgi:uncharacterized membrane protein YhaH (DUF805 family)
VSSGPLPIRDFLDVSRAKRDVPALCIAGAVCVCAVLILTIPFSDGARTMAQRRFHQAGLSFPTWALLQPVPAMYNFDNRWSATGVGAGTTAQECASNGRLPHHVVGIIVLARVPFLRCGAPVELRLRSTYRGTTVETVYRVERVASRTELRVVRLDGG